MLSFLPPFTRIDSCVSGAKRKQKEYERADRPPISVLSHGNPIFENCLTLDAPTRLGRSLALLPSSRALPSAATMEPKTLAAIHRDHTRGLPSILKISDLESV